VVSQGAQQSPMLSWIGMPQIMHIECLQAFCAETERRWPADVRDTRCWRAVSLWRVARIPQPRNSTRIIDRVSSRRPHGIEVLEHPLWLLLLPDAAALNVTASGARRCSAQAAL